MSKFPKIKVSGSDYTGLWGNRSRRIVITDTSSKWNRHVIGGVSYSNPEVMDYNDENKATPYGFSLTNPDTQERRYYPDQRFATFDEAADALVAELGRQGYDYQGVYEDHHTEAA